MIFLIAVLRTTQCSNVGTRSCSSDYFEVNKSSILVQGFQKCHNFWYSINDDMTPQSMPLYITTCVTVCETIGSIKLTF